MVAVAYCGHHSRFVSGLILALLGVFASQAIHDHLPTISRQNGAMQCWRFTLILTFAATGFVAAFSNFMALCGEAYIRRSASRALL